MLLTVATKNDATTLVEGIPNPTQSTFPLATRKRVLNSAVKLFGSNQAKTQSFTGSGVIFNVDAGAAYILTAAHNLLIWAALPGPPNNWNNYLSAFAKAIKIGYGNADMTFNKAPTGTSDPSTNSIAAPPLPGPCTGPPLRNNCMYDLIAIRTTDGGVRAYAQQYVFGGQSFNAIDTQVQQEGAKIKNSTAALLDWKSYYYVQLGYGDVKDDRDRESLDVNGLVQKQKVIKYCQPGTAMIKNNLHYRLANPSGLGIVSMYNQVSAAGVAPSYFEYANTISLPGPMSSTTCEGDSGGPLWAVAKDFSETYLLGVTTGGDMLAGQQVQRRVFRNVISTTVAAYFNTIF
jgi:hypothetical protein